MLFTHPSLDAEETAVLERIEELRRSLRHYVVQSPRRWTGLLARMTRAQALRASNGIEGINVTAEDALAAVDNESPTDADKDTWQAVEGYQAAMDYVLQRCRDDHFKFSEDFVLAVHFMISRHDLDANPGNFRPGWVAVRNTESGEVVHEGVERDLLEPLVNELVDYINTEDDTQPPILKAAMSHLNLTVMHPFSDGNGRTARCLQTAVLANEGMAAPIFSSIEEYIGRNQQSYYDVLSEVGGGGWNPERNSRPWVRFCLMAHCQQAELHIRRTKEIEQTYVELENLVSRAGLHERTALALLQAASGLIVRNASYRTSADISANAASRELKSLADAGLLIAKGDRRGRNYVAAPPVAEIANRHRDRTPIEDPFENPSILGQSSLFK
jgi:Fic family protein